MSHQVALTVVATVRSDAIEPLARLLADMANDPAGNAVVPFGQLSRVHFARLVVLDEVRDGDGELIGPQLLLMSDVDTPLDAHVEQLASVAGLDVLFGHCDGYPSGHVTAGDRLRFLRDHAVDNPAVYVHRIGRTVHQIRQEQRLREAIEEFVDRNLEQWRSSAPETIHAAVRRHIGSDPSLAWALRKPRGPGVVQRLRDTVHLVGVAAALLILTPVMLIGAPFYAVALRWHEWRDPARGTRPDPTHVARLAEVEDFAAHNQFTAVGFLKPGRFRRYTAAAALFLLNYACRHFFAKANLAGVRTIHFARWVFLDDMRRVLFASNYDGSLESYMDDFIDKVAWGLNLVFSNGVGYPKTSWLVLGGARDEQAFKRYIRLRQVPSQVWYSAYPDLTARNIENNSAIRAGLARRLDWSDAQAWVHAAVTALDVADIQGIIASGYGHLPFARYVLVQISSPVHTRRWLGHLAGRLTDASGHRAPPVNVNVAFTASGLAKLAPAQAISQFSYEFLIGMVGEHSRRVLGDTGEAAPEQWRWGGPATPDIDVLLLLFAVDVSSLEAVTRDLLSHPDTAGISEVVRLETAPLGPLEHFGFHDGISQPAVEGLHRAPPEDTIRAGEFVLGYPNEYGRVAERPLVHAAGASRGTDGSGQLDIGRNGTYLVFRQLEQHVDRFRAFLGAQTQDSGASDPDARRRLAAKLIGRWPSGAPLVRAPLEDDPSLADVNDFGYHHEDPAGHRCPIGSHIRRAHPRDMLEPGPGTERSVAIDKRHRILRRGRSYGPFLPEDAAWSEANAADPDGVERGLMFLCLCANIARQFEFLSHTWLNNPKFAGLYDDPDPLVGAPSPGRSTTFTVQGDPIRQRLLDVPRFVTPRGGAYFFLPSTTVVRHLAEPA